MNDCKVTIIGWDSPLRTVFQIECRKCDRMLGTFTQHESAMAWAHAHAGGSKHIRGEGT